MMEGMKGDAEKHIGLGDTSTAQPKSPPKKVYPSLYLNGLSKDNPLVKKEVGADCDAGVKLKVVSKRENSDGTYDVSIEVRDMWTRRSA